MPLSIFAGAISAVSIGVLLLSAPAAGAQDAPEPVAAPAIAPWGYPLDALDRSVTPGDDFFRYANGAWLDRTSIPPDQRIGYPLCRDERQIEGAPRVD